MDLLANYDDDNTEDNSISESPKRREINNTSNQASSMLENEWLSFEQMIATGGSGSSDVVNSTDFLVNGIVAYPGMKGASTSGQGSHSKTIPDDESSASSNSDTEDKLPDDEDAGRKEGKGEEDDAFFRLRKQVKERDRSTSSDRSGSSGSSSRSSSRSKSPSPPHLSPVTSIKSHTSEPPDLTETDVTETETTGVPEEVEEKEVIVEVSLEAKKRSKSTERKRSRSRDRKRSHREHRSKHDHSSRSKRRRSSRSRSRDRKRRRSRDRHRHKKSKDRSSKNDEKRSKSKERKESTSEATKSDGMDRKDSTKIDNKNMEEADKKSGKSDSKVGVDNKTEGRDRKDSARSASRHSDSEKTEAKKSASGESKDKDTKSDSQRKRSRSRSKDRKKDKKRSRSRHRHRSRSKDRKERRRSKSKERKRSRSKDRKKKHRSRSKERRSRSRHRSKDRHSRSRSRERLRSRSPVLGRKLTFKEQMRKEFINASKEMSHDNKIVTSLDALRKPGEALRPSDLLKGVKLTSGESVTPQMALIQTMAAMHKKAQELTGVEVPKYYNPAAVNPIKYAEQVQKRKLLWSKKPEEKDKTKNEQMETQWKSAFASSDDNKTASKFRKLMGMKEGDEPISLENLPEEFQKLTEEQKRKQAELFQRLDQEYQFARMTTHTQRGVGLGFATTVIDPNHPHSQNPP